MHTLSHFEHQDSIAWRFETANFTITLIIEPEDMDPADSFQFEEDIAAVRNGEVEWFRAGLIVFGPNGEEIAADWLGGCAYKSIREFYTSHRTYRAGDYFTDMIHEACRRAREHARKRGATYLSLRAV